MTLLERCIKRIFVVSEREGSIMWCKRVKLVTVEATWDKKYLSSSPEGCMHVGFLHNQCTVNSYFAHETTKLNSVEQQGLFFVKIQ